jgi:hypothetical protein
MRLVLALVALLAGTAGQAHAAGAGPLVPRELASLTRASHALVQLDGRRGEADVRRAGGTPVSRRLSLWRLPSAAAVRLVPRLAVAGAVVDFEPERSRTRHNHGAAGDPLVPEQWWLAAVGADRADAPGPGKPVAIVDSGVDLSHPEFAGRPDTVVLNEQRLVGGREFHGTAVASVAGAPANGAGMVGVYPAASLALWDASPRGQLTTTSVIEGLEAAAARGPAVINLSIGGVLRSRFEEQAVLDAVAQGSLVVAASGNERRGGDPPNYPASLPHVLTVGSLSQAGAVSSFSSSSPGMDLVAPGESVLGAVPAWAAPEGYELLDGTSFAAPIVSAAAAWVWTARADLDAGQVAEALRLSARDLDAPGRDTSGGYGVLDIPAALAVAAPARDPFEPNDDVAQVRADGFLGRATPSLTTPARGRGTVSARIDAAEDPRDVYRVWVPARRRVVAVAKPAGAVRLRLLAPIPAGVRAVSTAAGFEIRNPSRTGRQAYLAASPGSLPRSPYALTLATRALPR